MRKYVFFVVALFIFASVATIGFEADASNKTILVESASDMNIIIKDASSSPIVAVQENKISLKRDNARMVNMPVANLPEDEIHPNVANGGGYYFAGYTYAPSIVERNVYTTYSADGVTWEPFVSIAGDDISDYSAFDFWGGGRFCGTFVGTEPLQYLLDAQDIADPEAPIDLIYWDWSDNGWSELKEFDIACHNSQNEWEYGVMATVGTTDYEGWEVENGPHMFFRSPDEEGTGYISWNIYPGCAHSAASIDKTTDTMYLAYDFYNETTARWNILVWKRDFADPLEGDSEFIEIQTDYYAQYPSVGASNGNVIVVAESEEFYNLDIVCYYSSDGGQTFQTSYITNTPGNEGSPDILMSGSQDATVIYTLDGDLYASSTDDGGATWSTPTIINDQTGTVVEDWRTADTCDGAAIWADERDGNADIYFATLGNAPSTPSRPEGPTSGRTRQSLTYTTVSTDPNGDQVYYMFDWGDGTDSGWVGPFNSGEEGSASYRWTSQGEYQVKVKAKDTSDNESPWSDPLSISVPRAITSFIDLVIKLLERIFIFSL